MRPLRQLVAAVARRVLPASGTVEGYEAAELVDVVFRKTVAFDPPPMPEMAGVASVLDFGGGCGAHYKAAVKASPAIRWAVVETSAMADRAKSLETDNLRFFDHIPAAAAWLGHVEVAHSSGALQYTPDPEQTIERLCAVGPDTLLWKRIALAAGAETETEMQVSYLADNGPGFLPGIPHKQVHYPVNRIPERAFFDAHRGYAMVERGAGSFRFNRSQSP